MKAISVRQPWAWLLIHGGKDIENRDWPTRFRGQIGIQAAKGMTLCEYWDAIDFVIRIDGPLALSIPAPEELVRGSIIGTMILRDCVTDSISPWFQGKYGFVMTNPEPCDPIAVRGALGIWEYQEHIGVEAK